MSNSVFPYGTGTLPGLDIEVQRETIYSTTVHQTVGGKEQRTSWEATPRYLYTLKFNCLRTDVSASAPYATYSEAGLVQAFVDTHKGAFDSFLFYDPYDNSQVRVRMDADSYTVRQIVKNVWEAELVLRSVK